MSESRGAWGPLRRELERRVIDGWDFMRIENTALPGTPDLNIAVPVNWGFENDCIICLWVELKEAREDEKGKLDLGLRKEQYIWLRDKAAKGRKCFLLARVTDSHGSVNWIVWIKPRAWELAKYPQPYGQIIGLAAWIHPNVSALVDFLQASAR